MTKAQAARVAMQKLTASQSVGTLVQGFEITEEVHTPEVSIVRGEIMDELERRDAVAFDAWIDSNEGSPRRFFIK